MKIKFGSFEFEVKDEHASYLITSIFCIAWLITYFLGGGK